MITQTIAKCFFLDANIVISDILNENNPRIAKLKEDSRLHNIPCYISDSIKKELSKKVTTTCNFLGDTIRKTVKAALEDARTRKNIPLTVPMTYEDVKALEDLFSVCHDRARSQKICLIGPLEVIEQWSIKFIGDRLNKNEKITIDVFIFELTKALLPITSAIDDLYDNLVEFEQGHIKTKTVSSYSGLEKLIEITGIHYPDNVHVAAAFMYQTNNNEKVVFTTQDYGIIDKKPDLWRQQVKIEVSDPLYALYHF